MRIRRLVFVLGMLLWTPQVWAQCSGYSTTPAQPTVLSTQSVAAQGGITATVNGQVSNVSGGLVSHNVTVTPGTQILITIAGNGPSGGTAYSYLTINSDPTQLYKQSQPLSGPGTQFTWTMTSGQIGEVYHFWYVVTGADGNTTQDRLNISIVSGNGPSIVSQDAIPTNFYAYMSGGFKGPSMADACTLCQNQPYKCINKMHHPKQHWQATNSTSGEHHDAGWVYGNVACETCAVSYSGSSPFISFNPGDQLSFNVEDQVVCDEFGIIFDNNGGDTFDMETEYAFTTEQTKQSTCQVVGGGIQCSVAYYCKAGTTPPDFEPAAVFSNEFCANGVGKCTSADIPTFPPFWLTAGGGIRVRIGGWGPWFFPFYDSAGYVYGVRQKSEFINFLFDVLDMAMPWTSTPVACTNADLGTGPLWWP